MTKGRRLPQKGSVSYVVKYIKNAVVGYITAHLFTVPKIQA
jgi:hypothetical protein